MTRPRNEISARYALYVGNERDWLGIRYSVNVAFYWKESVERHTH